MKQYLLLLTWQYRGGETDSSWEIHDDLERARLQQSQHEANSESSSTKLVASVILKVKVEQ